MERKHGVLIFIFVSIACISLAGFFSSYLSHMPDYGKFPVLIHVHFLTFLCWLALIVIQPILIRRKNFGLHRKIGRLSYVLAPILIVPLVMLISRKIIRLIPENPDGAAFEALLGLLDVVSFATYYVIAMANRRNVRWHVAFILAASLVALNPGMARLLNLASTDLGMLAAVLTPFVLSISVIVFEKVKYKRPILKSPYALFFVCWTAEIAILMTVAPTQGWKEIVLRLA